MIPRLHLLMPCAYPDRLNAILPSYTTAMEKHGWELRVHLLIQGPDPDPKGILKVNEALDEIRGYGGWFMTPSDDTIQHPALFRRLFEELEKNPDAVAMVVGQERRDGLGNLWASPDQVRIGRIDGCQVCWNRDWIRSERYEWEKFGCYCDGEFAVRMFARAPQRFVFINEMLTRHNSLQWQI
jgi:hypothetical protein